MTILVEPQVYMLAQTMINHDGMDKYLDSIGAKGWKTEAFSDAEELIEVAGKSCYMSFNTSLNSNLTRVGTRDNHNYIKDSIIRVKHFSVIEHASITFGFIDVSRVMTHELVRHRHLSFSQVSGRFVRTDQIRYWLPKVIRDNPALVNIFDSAFQQMEINIKHLEEESEINNMKSAKDFIIKKKLTSAFRRIIGNGQANHIIVSGNHRAWREIISLRTDPQAEEEIRLVFEKVYFILKKNFPSLYEDAEIEEVEGITYAKFSK